MKGRASFRVAVASVVVVVLVAAGVAVSVSGSTQSNHLSNLKNPITVKLKTPISGTFYHVKNLPPSRDNDAGRARSLDVTPDNDTDAWQRG